MKRNLVADRWLALLFCLLAGIVILVWVPLDTETGLVEKVRRRLVIGDALAPTIAGVFILLGACLVWIRPGGDGGLTKGNLHWMLGLITLFAVALGVMRYAGPVAAAWTDSGYRPLRATLPWSYIGFVLGGTVLIGTLTGLTQGRFTWRDFAIGAVAALVIALFYDLPFDNLLLPPNGDV